MASFLILDEQVSGTQVYYLDVEGLDEVNALTSMGVFNGSEEGYFEPDANATNFQAYIAMLRALGYGPYILAREMSMAEAAAYAYRLDVCDRSDGEHWITMHDMVNLLYNSLDVTVVTVAAYSSDGNAYYTDESRTVLTEYFGMYIIEGSITATEYTNIFGSNELSDDEVAIDKEVFETKAENIENLIGQAVRAYVKKNESTKDTILTFELIDDDALIISKDDAPSYNDFVLTYYPDNASNARKISLPKSVVVIYNGKVVSDNYEKAFDLTEGYIRVYKNEFLGNGYNLVVIEDYKSVRVVSREMSEEVIYTDRTDELKQIACNKNDHKVKIVDSVTGKAIPFEGLWKDVILSVKQSMDGEIVEIYVCQNYVQGTIKSINTGDRTRVTIDENEYELAEDYIPNKNFLLGYSGKFYLNTFGRICGMSNLDLEGNLQGYLYAIADKNSAFSSVVSVKIFDVNGAHIIADFAEKVNLDGSTKTCDEVKTALCPGGTLQRQLVMFGRNKKGEINYIDTSASSADTREDANTLYTFAPKGTYRWIRPQYSFDAKYPVWRGGSKVFMVPPPTVENPQESEFKVITFDGVDFPTNNTDYENLSMYKTDETTPFAETLIYEVAQAPAFHWAPSLLVVSDMSTVYDRTTEDIYQSISGYYMTRNSTDRKMMGLSLYVGNEVYMRTWGNRYASDPSRAPAYTWIDSATPVSGEEFASMIDEGDIIWYQNDLNGRIVRAVLVYDCSEDVAVWDKDDTDPFTYSNNKPDEFRNDNFALADAESVFLNTNSTSSQAMLTLSSFNDETQDNEICLQYSMLPSYFRAIVYDKEMRSNKFYQGTLNDIVTREQNPGDCSKVFVWMLDTYYNMIVVYR